MSLLIKLGRIISLRPSGHVKGHIEILSIHFLNPQTYSSIVNNFIRTLSNQPTTGRSIDPLTVHIFPMQQKLVRLLKLDLL